MPHRLEVTEVIDLTEAPRASAGGFLVQLISPGWGSSGYYSAEVLENAGRDGVFPAGTHMYIDHPTATENAERPERSVRDLAGVLAENAKWNGSALVAKVRPFAQHREALAEMRSDIGVSVRAFAEVSEDQNGRTVIDRLDEGISVDFVTKAGRGGRILQVLESAGRRPAERAVSRGVSEATANETREQLQQALHDAYGAEKTWIWVRDFDTSNVWYERETPDDSGCYQLGYTLTDGAVTLGSDPIEVRAETRYVPVTPAAEAATPNVPVNPAGLPTSTQESGKDTSMSESEEARLRQLEEAAGRVPTLEAKLVAESQRADTAEHQLAEERARNYARDFGARRVREANSELPGAVVDRIVEAASRTIPLGEDNRLDTAAFGTQVDEARTAEETYLNSIQPDVGRIRGLGPSGEQPVVSEADVNSAFADVFKGA